MILVTRDPVTSAQASEMLQTLGSYIEWSAADTTLDTLAELAPMQLELGFLRQAWERDAQAVQPVLAYRTRALSDRVLELSGLLNE